ncbi:814_t:CDS:2 [Cetraspora pellucida]|uniref:814_t:CDS:1 n=1 Tax=Cetraspora pellucida TaxID=1433469 RepID=A0A9N9H5E6_9GLOM|nr:814_t:CDS:2 [Cetraspora pellucida]
MSQIRMPNLQEIEQLNINEFAKNISNGRKCLNAFFVYRKVYTKRAIASGVKMKMTEISKLAGQAWKNEDLKVKKAYTDASKRIDKVLQKKRQKCMTYSFIYENMTNVQPSIPPSPIESPIESPILTPSYNGSMPGTPPNEVISFPTEGPPFFNEHSFFNGEVSIFNGEPLSFNGEPLAFNGEHLAFNGEPTFDVNLCYNFLTVDQIIDLYLTAKEKQVVTAFKIIMNQLLIPKIISKIQDIQEIAF